MRLCYHKISSRLDFGIGTRTPEDFTNDLRWIAAHSPSQRPVVSFDDGYEDTFTEAFPLLSQFGLTASLFVTTDVMGKPNSWDANFFGAFNHISLSQVAELSVAGWHIGSHAKTHRALTTLSEADLKTELDVSRQVLEDATGKAVTEISFPFGKFDGRVLRACRKAGYTSAVSISGATPDGYVNRGLAVYRFDTLRQLQAKFSGNPHELRRLAAINACSGLTVAMQHFKSFLHRNLSPELSFGSKSPARFKPYT
ncbi:MAG: polysaccharide deacetylase family protein [Rhizobacter sp.]|nr:polysaccharide deacetylase family protein [Chlorobiales bacterium]